MKCNYAILYGRAVEHIRMAERMHAVSEGISRVIYAQLEQRYIRLATYIAARWDRIK